MKKRHFFTLFTLFLLISGLVVSAFALTPSPTHHAYAIVLADANTGDIIYAQNEHEQINPASTTKIMTALLAVEALDRGDVNIHDMLVTSQAALADMVPAGANIGLEVDEEMRFESLLYAVMLVSANDATNVIAERLGGTIDNFVQMMNDRARELGALNTNFRNAHGLTQDGHYSTAYDLFRITEFAIQNPRFVELYSELERFDPATSRTFVSTNRMKDPTAPEYYHGALGVKTGFTNAAGWCLVSTATRGDISLLAVVMGVPADVDGINHFSETAALYDWAFENLEYTEILPANTEITRVPISLGDGADTIGLRPQHSVNALVLQGTTLQDIRQEIVLFFDEEAEPLVAPVSQGTVLGQVTFYADGRTFGPMPLIAGETVALSRTAHLRYEVGNTLGSTWVRVVIIVLVLLLALYVVYAVNYSIKKRRRRKERLNRYKDRRDR